MHWQTEDPPGGIYGYGHVLWLVTKVGKGGLHMERRGIIHHTWNPPSLSAAWILCRFSIDCASIEYWA